MVAWWPLLSMGHWRLMRVAERSAPAVLRGPRRVREHRSAYAGAVHLSLVAIVVEEYDPAIGFFVGTLGLPAR